MFKRRKRHFVLFPYFCHLEGLDVVKALLQVRLNLENKKLESIFIRNVNDVLL